MVVVSDRMGCSSCSVEFTKLLSGTKTFFRDFFFKPNRNRNAVLVCIILYNNIDAGIAVHTIMMNLVNVPSSNPTI